MAGVNMCGGQRNDAHLNGLALLDGYRVAQTIDRRDGAWCGRNNDMQLVDVSDYTA